MDVLWMIDELRQERERLNDAIVALERLSAGSARRRGRPAKRLARAASEERAIAQDSRQRGRGRRSAGGAADEPPPRRSTE